MSHGHYHLQCFDQPTNLASTAAHEWVAAVGVLSHDRQFNVALSGGRITVPFLQEAAALFAKSPDYLNRLTVFWADERCVAPEHEDSNYAMFMEHFAIPTFLPEARIHRFKGEEEPEQAAQKMASTLTELLPVNEDGVPVFDLVLLGMGEDGHVASLFPENMTEDLRRTGAYAFDVVASKLPPQRLTLSYQVLQSARHVWALISGEGKESALSDSLKCQGHTPLAHVIQGRTHTEIFTDFTLEAPV